jgi:serine/threonine protein kinase
MNQRTCDATRLSQFLGDDLSSHEELLLTGHLDQCTSCRDRLDELAADQASWTEVKAMLCDVVDQVTCTKPANNNDSLQIRQVLAQLGPTDDPQSLGRIGGYEVTGVVGAGGMGVVLKAHDRSLDRVVAVKVMSPHLASSGSARKRFAREAKAAAAVLHPNVIAIHSVASEDANPFLVMPYVRGASLQKRIDSQGPLPLKETLRIGAQIAAGLAAAHEQGLVHRDIKPANILLEEGVERVTITDFGLARAVDDASMTCSGVIAGTPQYMSPEQARGEAIDARSDLFSLGSVLYAMCAGRSPFRAETTYGVLHRIANDNPAPVCEVNSDVPDWLGHIINRLMAKRAEDRFESAAQVAELLEGCLAHVQQPSAIPLPAGVQALAAQSQRSSSEIPKPNRLKAKHQRIPPLGKFIAAAAFAFTLLFAGVLIVLDLNKGTLTIESELDDVPIRIIQGDNVVMDLTVSRDGKRTSIAAGKYSVEIESKFDNAVIVNNVVTISRGETETIKVSRRTQNISMTPTLAEATAQFNQQSAEDRRTLFSPPIPDLTEEQLREGFRQAADQYRRVGESDIAAVLEKIVETGRLPDGVGSNLVASGATTRNDTGEIETQQIAPALIIKRKDSSHRLVLLRSLELLYRKTGTSSKDYGDAGRSQDHANSEKVSPTLNSHMSNIVINAEPVPVATKLWNVAGAVFKPVTENELLSSGWKGGLRVTHLRENGPAEEAMIRIGDIVVEMDGEPITTSEAMDHFRGRTSYGVPLTVRLLRDDKEVLARIKWDQRFLQPLGTGVVQDRDKSTVVVSLGTDDGVYPGDRLNTSSLPLGTLEVVTATTDQCAARIISEDERVPIKKGDLVNYGQMKFLTPPAALDTNQNMTSTLNFLTEGKHKLVISGDADPAEYLHLQIGDEPNAPEWVLGLGGRFIATFEYSEELSAEGGKHVNGLRIGIKHGNGNVSRTQIVMTKDDSVSALNFRFRNGAIGNPPQDSILNEKGRYWIGDVATIEGGKLSVFVQLKDVTDTGKRAEEPLELSPAEQALSVLEAEYNQLESDYYQASEDAADEHELNRVYKEMDPRHIMPSKYLAMEEKYRGTDEGLKALVQVCSMARSVAGANSGAGKGRREAVKRVIDHYLEREGLESIIASLGGGPFVPQADELLQALVEKSPFRKTQAEALIAQIISGKETLLVESQMPKVRAVVRDRMSEAPPALRDEFEQRLKTLENTDFNQLRRELNEKLERLANLYSDVAVDHYGTGAAAAHRLSHAINKVIIGQPAPELAGTDIDGKPFRLSELRGKHVVLMFAQSVSDDYGDMYAPMRQLVAKYKQTPVRVVGIMSNADPSHLHAAAKRGDLNWTVIPQPLNGPLQLDWGIEGYPAVYIIDANGTLHPPLNMPNYGEGGYDTKEVTDELDELLKEHYQKSKPEISSQDTR